MLALIVTSEMALVRFLLMPPAWWPDLESDRAKIWHTDYAYSFLPEIFFWKHLGGL
jgi:hypothetical protein